MFSDCYLEHLITLSGRKSAGWMPPRPANSFIDNHSHCDYYDLRFLLSNFRARPPMYVCLCNGITESQIRDAVGDGARTLSELNLCLGVASCCGRCADCAQQVLHESLSSSDMWRQQLSAA